MKFAVLINGKKHPVSVKKEPNSSSALSCFTLEGKTYHGLPEQFNNLRYDSTKKCYNAASILIKKTNGDAQTAKIEPQPVETQEEQQKVLESESEQVIISSPTNSIPAKEIIIIPPVEEIHDSDEPRIEEEEEEEEEEVSDRNERSEFLSQLEQEATKLQRVKELQINSTNFGKKAIFSPRWSYLFPKEEMFGEAEFEKHKRVWIHQHGSEHLKMANEMQCKCDCLYITERSQLEFPQWAIHENLLYNEIDSPDYGVLTFIKNFKKIYKDVLNPYHSKIFIGITDTSTEDNPDVIITDYLGHCDLSIPLSNLVRLYGDKC